MKLVTRYSSLTTRLTSRQRQVLSCVVEAIRANGYVPSIREIAQTLGIRSPSTVHQHLEALERKGYLKRHGDRMRVLEITDDRWRRGGDEVAYLPLLGRVAAGGPILAEENMEDLIPIPRSMVGWQGECFLLTVKGDSMIEAGIFDGDLVVVRCQPTANPGDIVVALIEGEATVKRLRYEGSRPYLEPANPRYLPIGGEFEIIGKVVGLLRRYTPVKRGSQEG